MALSNMNWNVQYKASDIQYNNNLPSSMRLDTIDIAGNTFTQSISNISYIQSQDTARYQGLVKTWERNANDSSKYMYRQSLDAVKSGIDPPKFLPKSFTIETTGPQGTKNTINFLNVKWNNDRIVSFDAVVSSVERGLSQNPFSPEGRGQGEGVTLFKVSSIFQDNNKFLGVNIDITRNNETITHTWKTDDDISLDKFVEQIGLGVNPVLIMGSNTLQLGEAKIAALSVNYDDRGYLNNAVNVYDETKNNTFTENKRDDNINIVSLAVKAQDMVIENPRLFMFPSIWAGLGLKKGTIDYFKVDDSSLMFPQTEGASHNLKDYKAYVILGINTGNNEAQLRANQKGIVVRSNPTSGEYADLVECGLGKTVGEVFPGAGRLAHLAAEDMKQLASEKRDYVFHSQGTIIAKNALKILADQGIKFSEGSQFVFLGPAVKKKDILKIAFNLGIEERKVIFNANPKDIVANLFSDHGKNSIWDSNLKDHCLDSYKWWKEWNPNEKHN
ncbi:MAG: hypothetical protein ABH857_00155 [Elusimicrobiota bacterium]